MQRIEYRTIDKSLWGDGPWMGEPDKVQWRDEATGLPCLIVRNPELGFLCGYVGVPKAHPAHGMDYDDIYTKWPDVGAHGGLTFAGGCSHSADQSRGICHKPDPGEPDDVHWFGFDCGHAFDLAPGTRAILRQIDARLPQPPLPRALSRNSRDTYRDISYVAKEVTQLAQQLKDICGNAP